MCGAKLMPPSALKNRFTRNEIVADETCVRIYTSHKRHGCIAAKIPGTSEPYCKSDTNLSPTANQPSSLLIAVQNLFFSQQNQPVSTLLIEFVFSY